MQAGFNWKIDDEMLDRAENNISNLTATPTMVPVIQHMLQIVRKGWAMIEEWQLD